MVAGRRNGGVAGAVEEGERSEGADGEVLGEGGEEAEEKVEGVLEEDGQMRDGRGGGEGGRERFDGGPGEVDVEEEEEDAEADDGWLVDGRGAGG